MDANKLEALADLTAEADAQGGPTPEQLQEVAAADAAELAAQQWGMLPYTIGQGLAVLAPELRQVYTEEACMNWGRAMVPVAEKRGWSGPANCPEVALGLASLGLVVPTVLAVKRKVGELKAARAAEAKQQQPQQPAQGAADGSPP